VIAFAPGSLPFLLAHEMRITLRQFSGKKRWGAWVGGGLIVLFMLAGGVPMAWALRQSPPLATTADFNLFAALVALFTFTLLMSQTLSMTVMAFFERGDFDLLFSSPVVPARVLFVRCLSIALAPALLYAAMVSPFLLPAIVLADFRLVAAYGVLAALTLLGAAAGMAAALGLFFLLGPRRTKTVGQILAAGLGAIVFMAFQIPNVAPGTGANVAAVFKAATQGGRFEAASPLSLFARAVLAEPVALIALLAVALAVFSAVARALGPAFAHAVAASAGADSPRPPKRQDGRAVRFCAGPKAALIRKEMTLIARDPALISQVLLRVLYFVPLALVLMRESVLQGQDMLVIGATGSIVMFASQIAGSLAWIAISAEDAPDLIHSAPVSGPVVRAAKLTAALVPVAVLAAAPVALLLVFHPWAGVVTALFTYLASLSVCYVNLWYEKPQKRSAFRRRGQGSMVANLGEALLGFAFLPVTVLVAAGTLWAAPFALLPVAILGGLYLGRRHEA
jgi:ABC-2 type transport system permease protein